MPEVLRLGFSIILSYKNHKIIHYNLSRLPGREKCKVLSAGLKISKSKERNYEFKSKLKKPGFFLSRPFSIKNSLINFHLFKRTKRSL